MKKLSQKGFTVIEALLVVVIVGAIAGVGWYVWNSQAETDKTLQESNNAASSVVPQQNKVDPNTMVLAKFSTLPVAFKSAYVQHAKTNDGICVDKAGNPLSDDGQAYDPGARYIPGGYVAVPECNAGAIYAYSGGKWVFVGKTVEAYSCTDLEKYKVPVELLTTEQTDFCFDENDNHVVYPRT